MKLKNYIFVLVVAIFSTVSLIGQSIGVRAGWNFSKFSGPLEAGEEYKSNNGIHFGVNYGYKVSKNFQLRAEILYNQTGTQHNYDTSSYYLIYADKTIFEKGRRTQKLQISNSYIGLPITAAYQIGKVEFLVGLNPSILINPVGRGTVRFESQTRPKEIIFKQSLDHRYNSDKALAAANSFSQSTLQIIVDGRAVSLPKAVGAYYQNDIVQGKRFGLLNLSAIGGVNYFINRGLYVGLRLEQGLIDVTNDKMDFSLSSLNEDLTQKIRNDKDIQLTYQVSLGFRF